MKIEKDEDLPALLAHIREQSCKVNGWLPTEITVAALGVKSKGPFIAFGIRAALLWRTEELSRSAYEALERRDISVAAILARAVTENASMLWRLKTLIEKRATHTEAELHTKFAQLMFGNRQWDDVPQALNILTCIDEVDKVIPNFRKMYDSLSEYSHPNWAGVARIYSRTEYAEHKTTFGRDLIDHTGTLGLIGNALAGGLTAIEYCERRFEAEFPKYLEGLEKF